ncbi:MAG: hypothetical protein GY851_27830 [bacterium]|nr:hypothetical protein [bacterium]
MTMAAVVFAGAAVLAETLSIDPKKVDEKKIYWGQYSSFSQPGEVKYEKVVTATDEYKELKKKRLKRGTGKYWILMSQSSDRTVRAIADVGEWKGYDLIAAQGYLASLKLEVKVEDITALVLDAVKNPEKIKKAIKKAKDDAKKKGE